MAIRLPLLLVAVCILGVGCDSALAFQRGFLAERLRARLESRRDEAVEISQGRRDLGNRRQGSAKPHESMTIAGVKVAFWKPQAPGQHPLVLFSHGLNGCSTQSTFLTQALANAGYFVAAPDHADAKCGGSGIAAPEERLGDPESWTDSTYASRRDDMRTVLEGLKHSQWADVIDWRSVVLVGHSLGGYTVLGLGGGWSSWEIPRVRAVVALSPYCQPYAVRDALKDIRVPVMYQGGTRDIGITPAVRRPGGCYDQAPGPAMFVELDGAGHFAWADAMQTHHTNIIYYVLAFLDAHVKGASPDALTVQRPGVSDLRIK